GPGWQNGSGGSAAARAAAARGPTPTSDETVADRHELCAGTISKGDGECLGREGSPFALAQRSRQRLHRREVARALTVVWALRLELRDAAHGGTVGAGGLRHRLVDANPSFSERSASQAV